MERMPFCVLEKPFCVWGHNIKEDSIHFLRRIDADFYFRFSHKLLSDSEEYSSESESDEISDQTRKQISSMARLLWHHGTETLLTLLGAYIQAPFAVHAYFLKCKTEDITEIGKFLFLEKNLKYNHLNNVKFTLRNLIEGIHIRANWSEKDKTIDDFTQVLRNILRDFCSDEHRSEYNSIKHGLRVSHGKFSLAIGQEKKFGVPPAPEDMKIIGYSRDASFFGVSKSMFHKNGDKQKSNFYIEKINVVWSLEKVICETQILSMLIHNLTSEILVLNGIKSDDLTFIRTQDDHEFWELYKNSRVHGVSRSSFSDVIDTSNLKLLSAIEIYSSYKNP